MYSTCTDIASRVCLSVDTSPAVVSDAQVINYCKMQASTSQKAFFNTVSNFLCSLRPFHAVRVFETLERGFVLTKRILSGEVVAEKRWSF